MKYQELVRRQALEAGGVLIPATPLSTAASPTTMLWPFAGSWIGRERRHPSAWGEACIARGVATMRMYMKGRMLLQTYRLERPGRRVETAYAVMAIGAEEGQLEVFWFDALVPKPVAVPGRWGRARLGFLRGTPLGDLRHSYAFRSEDSYTFLLEGSTDGGQTWSLVTEGLYTRAGS